MTLAFDASRTVNLYAKYATGYRSGGASSRSVTYREFGPEDVKSYEIGAKTEWFDRRLRVNAAAYIMDRTGSQVDFSTVVSTGGTSTRNTLDTINAPGTTKIRGVEVDFIARVTENLQLSGAYAYTYTKVPDTADPQRPGSPLVPVFIVFTPRNVANGAVDYEVPLAWNSAKLRFHMDGNYNQGTQSFAEYATKNDSSFVVNARRGAGRHRARQQPVHAGGLVAQPVQRTIYLPPRSLDQPAQPDQRRGQRHHRRICQFRHAPDLRPRTERQDVRRNGGAQAPLNTLRTEAARASERNGFDSSAAPGAAARIASVSL